MNREEEDSESESNSSKSDVDNLDAKVEDCNDQVEGPNEFKNDTYVQRAMIAVLPKILVRMKWT